MTGFGRRNAAAIGLLAAAPLWGCGMKGPPRAPLVRTPAPATDLVVQRVGDEVSIGFTLPTANEDRSEPASLERVDIYAMTTRPRLVPDRTLDLEEFREAATLVASLEVAPPPAPESEDAPADEPPPAETDPAEPAPPRQGEPVLLTEALTAETAVPVDPWEEERRRREQREAEDEDEDDEDERPVRVPLMTPPSPGPLQREYALVYVSMQGDESEGGERTAVPLDIRPPEPPPVPRVVYSETTADVTWDLPPGVRETVQGPATAEPPDAGTAGDGGAGDGDAGEAGEAGDGAAGEADEAGDGAGGAGEAGAEDGAAGEAGEAGEETGEAGDGAGEAEDGAAGEAADAGAGAAGEAGAGETGEAEDGAGEAEDGAEPLPPPLESRPVVEWPPASTYELFEVAAADADSSAVPEPLSPSPLDAPSYADSRVEYGVERCYAVRTLDVVAGFEVRSRLSPPACVTFADTFPPAAPQALTAVGSAGEVSLLWRPNDEPDLAGYVVLRGAPGDETLQPLTGAPLVENTYRDVTAQPGVRHVYAVRAVDTAPAPNLSDPSDRVEAAAR